MFSSFCWWPWRLEAYCFKDEKWYSHVFHTQSRSWGFKKRTKYCQLSLKLQEMAKPGFFMYHRNILPLARNKNKPTTKKQSIFLILEEVITSSSFDGWKDLYWVEKVLIQAPQWNQNCTQALLPGAIHVTSAHYYQ